MGSPFNKTEIRAGETDQFLFSIGNSSFDMSGTMNCRFGGIENITVPAGTYKPFKVEISTSNIHASSGGVDVSPSMNGQMRQEFGTCRLVDMNMQETEVSTQPRQQATINITIDMTLVQHTKP